MILAGDIGGTNTRLALFNTDLSPVKGSIHKYPSGQHKSLEEILTVYLETVPAELKIKKLKLKYAGFGVAGPVRDGKVKTTNLPWLLDAKKLAKELKVKQAALVNDLYATAAGIEVLPKKSFEVLRKGERLKSGGTRAVIAPGTGLGHASLIWTGKKHLINPSELGHAEFAAASDEEDRLREFIAAKSDPTLGFFGRCSYENVLSGPGLRNIYDFLVTVEGHPNSDAVTAADLKDKAGIISQAGLSEAHPTCAKALEIFTAIFGRQAGNLALAVLAQDGLYLGGGIPPKILPALKKPAFLAAFNNKGSQHWIEQVPVAVITDDLCALYGSANCASRV
jgi:glucokinase